MKIERYGSTEPLVSICVPVFEPSARLGRLMASLDDYTHVSYEVVVANCEGQQLGYTAPQNRAVAAAQSDIVVAANDDIVICNHWTFPLISALEDGAWCATPDMTHTDGPQVFAPYFMMWWRDRWDEIGGLDERFVFWASDIDLARRLVDAGHPPVRVPLDAAIHHEGSETTRDHSSITPHFNQVARDDLDRFAAKWNITAEQEKGRLAQLVLFGVET